MKLLTCRPDALGIVALALLSLIGFALHDPFWLQVVPPPSALVVVLVAMVATQAQALTVAAVAAILHLVGGWQGHTLAAVAWAPLAYPTLAWWLARRCGRARAQAEHALVNADDLRRRLEASEVKRSDLERSKHDMQAQAAAAADPLIAAGRKLSAQEPPEIYLGLLLLLQQTLGVERCAIWVADRERHFQRRYPEAGDGTLPPLATAVVEEGMVLSARDYFANGQQSGDGSLIAGPLRTLGLRVEAVVVIESLSAGGDLDPARVQRFQLLLDWASRALANISRFGDKDLKAVTGTSGRFNTLPSDGKEGPPAALLVCRIDGDIAEKVRRRIELVVRRVCRQLARPNDVVSFREEERACVMMMPNATVQVGDALRGRLQRSIDGYDFRPYADGSPLRLLWGKAESRGNASIDQLIAAALTEEDKC